MANCGACDLGIPHEHNGYHPAVFHYGSATAPDAAKWWYEQAMEVAKENNRLCDELRRYKESKLHQWLQGMIERYK